MSSVQVALSGFHVLGINGLTTEPDSGILYGLIRTTSTFIPKETRLVTINTGTGAATDLGALPDGFANIEFRLPVIPSGPMNVDVDIKPGSDPNSINLCSNGAVPVAILGSDGLDGLDGLDVTQIDTSTLKFADAEVKVVGKKDQHTLCSFEDVNDDGEIDLVCHFVTTDIGALDGDDTTAKVMGTLLDGTTQIEGSDSVNIVKDTCN